MPILRVSRNNLPVKKMRIEITENEAGRPLLHLLRSSLGCSARIVTGLKKRAGGILVNGAHVTVRYVLRAGDILDLALEDEAAADTVTPAALPLEILYEDEDILAVNKPPHMPAHPSRGHHADTLANGLADYYQKRNIPFVCRILTRLDRDTSGVVLLAKNKLSAHRLSSALANGMTEKRYLAFLSGIVAPAAGEITAPIRRAADSIILRVVAERPNEPGAKAACTRYRMLAESRGCAGGGRFCAVLAEPVTGRTHQLRVHFAHLGHPILGDSLYGGDCTLLARQALHACALTFPHPATGERITVRAPLPGDLARFAEAYFDKADLAALPGLA